MKTLAPLSATLAAVSVASTIFASTTITAALPDSMFFRQYQTAGDIPDRVYQNHQVIRVKVVKITDGDTIRVRHLPYYPLSLRSRYEGLLSENTISVRIYAVDCPETAKFGNPAQPLADEATEWTRKLVENKVVRIKLLSRDRYNRAIAKVQVRGFLPFTKTDVTMSLAQKGYATLYTGGGAQYDGEREKIEKKIETAKKKKRGIWKNGSNFETPAEYKKKVKQRNGVGATATVY